MKISRVPILIYACNQNYKVTDSHILFYLYHFSPPRILFYLHLFFIIEHPSPHSSRTHRGFIVEANHSYSLTQFSKLLHFVDAIDTHAPGSIQIVIVLKKKRGIEIGKERECGNKKNKHKECTQKETVREMRDGGGGGHIKATTKSNLPWEW